MKDIKFRAWDKVNKRMLYFNSGFGWNDEYNFWYLQGADADVPCENNIELMQYTGLKDKHGKDIYESDIAKDKILNMKTGKPEEAERIFEVYWDNKTASFWQRLITDKSKQYRSGTNFAAEINCEVIGNIYENPKLLKSNTK